MEVTKRKFIEHKYAARRRGIDFKFTFEEWVAWWEMHLGPDWLEKRGCKKGQYVMARNGDVGPYETRNVKCITCQDNNGENTKLSEFDMTAIRSSKLSGRKLAKEYNVHQTTIARIRRM